MSKGQDHGGDMPMPGGGSMSNDNGTMNMNDMATMHKSLFWGKDVIILFQGWPNHSLGMYILALAFVFFLSVAVEILSIVNNSAAKPGKNNPWVGGLIKKVSVYAVRSALSYLVMLSVMSFNLGIFIVAVAGHAVGFFIVKFYGLSVASPDLQQGTTNTISKV